MSALRSMLRVALPIATLAAGVMGMAVLVKTKPEPVKEQRRDLGVVVRTQEVEKKRQQLVIQAQGSVTPARQVVVQPEVQGRVIWKSKNLVPGGRFKQGEVLVRIDARQYSIEAEQRRATIDQAEQQLAIERARREIAKQEWQIIGEDGAATAEGRAVALREPQLKHAQAILKTAETAASLATLNVGRTSLSAPFDGFVQATTIDVGQLVGPQSQLATLVGSDAYWVQTSIPVKHLASIKVPGLNADKDSGSTAVVWQDVGGKRIESAGRVVRLLGDVDPVGRMARVLVEISDPLGLKRPPSASAQTSKQAVDPEHNGHSHNELPVLIGSYVHVEITADELVDVIEIPRLALRGGNKVQVLSASSTLETHEVSIVWRGEDSVLVDSGIKPGSQVIVSRIPSPVEGMKLRLETRQGPEPAPETASKK